MVFFVYHHAYLFRAADDDTFFVAVLGEFTANQKSLHQELAVQYGSVFETVILCVFEPGTLGGAGFCERNDVSQLLLAASAGKRETLEIPGQPDATAVYYVGVGALFFEPVTDA
jgi:hypothetical protein